jgi:excisionase family DNA binding protein
MIPQPDFLTVKEAADIARVSRSLVYAWCDERRLAHVRAGGAGKRGRILISRADLETLLREMRVERHPLLSAGG